VIEIERKFLVKSNEFKREAGSTYKIVQGFLNRDPKRTVRVRISGETGFLTIKGPSNTSGTARYEWEEKIALNDAKALMKLCEEGIIDKTRYEVQIGEHVFEVDEFHGQNEGLSIAEIELKSEDEIFQKPKWLGIEVTGETKYYNSQLSRNPYIKWKK